MLKRVEQVRAELQDVVDRRKNQHIETVHPGAVASSRNPRRGRDGV